MGARGKVTRQQMDRKAGRRANSVQVEHVDKYAPGYRRPAATSAPAVAPPPPSQPRPRRRVIPSADETHEQRVTQQAASLDAESEEVLASLPGGTPNERMRSAQRSMFQNQDAIQSAANHRDR